MMVTLSVHEARRRMAREVRRLRREAKVEHEASLVAEVGWKRREHVRACNRLYILSEGLIYAMKLAIAPQRHQRNLEACGLSSHEEAVARASFG